MTADTPQCVTFYKNEEPISLEVAYHILSFEKKTRVSFSPPYNVEPSEIYLFSIKGGNNWADHLEWSKKGSIKCPNNPVMRTTYFNSVHDLQRLVFTLTSDSSDYMVVHYVKKSRDPSTTKHLNGPSLDHEIPEDVTEQTEPRSVTEEMIERLTEVIIHTAWLIIVICMCFYYNNL